MHRQSKKGKRGVSLLLSGVIIAILAGSWVRFVFHASTGSVLSASTKSAPHNVCVTYLDWKDFTGKTQGRHEPYYAVDDPKIADDPKACMTWMQENVPGARGCGWPHFIRDTGDAMPYENPNRISAFRMSKTEGKNGPDKDMVGEWLGENYCNAYGTLISYRENESTLPKPTLNPVLTPITPLPTPTSGPYLVPTCALYYRYPPAVNFRTGGSPLTSDKTTKSSCNSKADEYAKKQYCGSTTTLFNRHPDAMIVVYADYNRTKFFLPQNINMESEFIGRYSCGS
jgi:hypothetical protein